MRIIGGVHGGRRIHPPNEMPHTRPTTDIAKEGLFNILEHQVEWDRLHTLDLFGGTGCISYEMASRGVSRLTVVEKDPRMHAFIVKTAQELSLPGFTVLRQEVFGFLNLCTDTFDLIFAGPPYALTEIERIPSLIFERSLLRPGGLFILEHTPRHQFTDRAEFRLQRHYGTTVFSFFAHPTNGTSC